MMNSYIWSSDAELWKHLFIWSMERLSKSSYWIPFFRHSKNSCWKTERVQGKKGCWSGTQGKVPQQWAREVEKRCWEREKEENWWPVWEGSEMEAQAVERVQRTTEEEVFQIHFYPSRQSRTQSDGVAATLKRMTDRLSQGRDVPGAWKLIRALIKARIALKTRWSAKHLSPSTLRLHQMIRDQVNEPNNISVVTERERAGWDWFQCTHMCGPFLMNILLCSFVLYN